MQSKKGMKKGILTGVAAVSRKASEFTANLPCVWWTYQPQMPKSVKKMRKF